MLRVHCRHDDDDFTDRFLDAVRTATPGRVVCYDKNFSGLSGVYTLCELLGTIEASDLDVRVLLVAPNYIDADLCFERIKVRHLGDHDGITADTANALEMLRSFVKECDQATKIVASAPWQQHVLRTDMLWHSPTNLELLVDEVERRLTGASVATVGELGKLVAAHHGLVALTEAPDTTGRRVQNSRAAGRQSDPGKPPYKRPRAAAVQTVPASAGDPQISRAALSPLTCAATAAPVPAVSQHQHQHQPPPLNQYQQMQMQDQHQLKQPAWQQPAWQQQQYQALMLQKQYQYQHMLHHQYQTQMQQLQLQRQAQMQLQHPQHVAQLSKQEHSVSFRKLPCHSAAVASLAHSLPAPYLYPPLGDRTVELLSLPRLFMTTTPSDNTQVAIGIQGGCSTVILFCGAHMHHVMPHAGFNTTLSNNLIPPPKNPQKSSEWCYSLQSASPPKGGHLRFPVLTCTFTLLSAAFNEDIFSTQYAVRRGGGQFYIAFVEGDLTRSTIRLPLLEVASLQIYRTHPAMSRVLGNNKKY